ncbi:hypothetical protein LINPERPRIM_LOCUS14196 [Linum perenne]
MHPDIYKSWISRHKSTFC